MLALLLHSLYHQTGSFFMAAFPHNCLWGAATAAYQVEGGH
ncbi:hypothetical protein ACN4GD_28975, partial [Klebsiella pneumoniae subsp. pneumoniae]